MPRWVINILDPATRWNGCVVADDRRPTTATEVSRINFTASSAVPSSNVFLPPPYRVRVSISVQNPCVRNAVWSGGASVPDPLTALDT